LPSPRNVSGTLTVRAVGPFNTARNQRSLLRRAKAAISPISETGSTIVWSQVLGMLSITSTAGLASRLFGLAP
jgi:hypothetical protein